MRTFLVAARWLCFALLLGACGGTSGQSGSAPDSPTTVATASLEPVGTSVPAEPERTEDKLAASLLLTLADLPVGWTEEIAGPEAEDDPLEECDEGDAPGLVGRAETGSFSAGGDRFDHAVAIFDSEESVQQAFSRIEAEALCVVELLNAGEGDTDEFAWTNASLSRGRPPTAGDLSSHLRVQVHVRFKNETGVLSETDAFIDLVSVTAGRFGSSITSLSILAPFDPLLLDSLVDRMSDRIVAAASAP